MIDEKHFRLEYQNCQKNFSDSELLHMLSSGTTKGIFLYIFIVVALREWF